MTDIRPSLFLLTGVLLSPPQFPSLLGGSRVSESRCLVGVEPGRGGLGQRADHSDLGEAWQIISTPSREAVCRDWNGHGPQTMPTFWTVLNGCTAQVDVSEPWIFSRYLTSGLLCSSFGQMNSSDVPAKELCPEPGSLWIHLLLMGQTLFTGISKTGPERGKGLPKFTQPVRTETTLDFQTMPK